MSSRIYKLLENYSDSSSETYFSEKSRAAGFYGKSDTTTSVQYELDNFVGEIVIQGTLLEEPGPNDWSDILNTDLLTEDSSLSVSSFVSTFTGNFVWIRAKYRVFDGTIQTISYIH